MENLNNMKYIIFLLSLVGFLSCKKCGTCHYTKTWSNNYGSPNQLPKDGPEVEYCGDDYEYYNGFDSTETIDKGQGQYEYINTKYTCIKN